MKVKNTEVTWIAPNGAILTTLHEIYCAYYGSSDPWVARMKITPQVEAHLERKGYQKQVRVRTVYDDLSTPQRDALDYAKSLYGQSPLSRQLNGGDSDGWFYAQFTTRGSIAFFCRPQTLEALYRRGLLERRVTFYGDGTIFREYRFQADAASDAR